MKINMARIFQTVAQEAFRNPKVIEEAWRHADEFCAAEDEARYSGFWGLPPEPGSWGLVVDRERERP